MTLRIDEFEREIGISQAQRLKKRTMKIPEFKSVDEELEFWSTHSALEFLDEGEEVEIDASGAREKRDRRETQQISLRMSSLVLARIKHRAKVLGVPYQTLVQIWLAERLEAEEARSKRLLAS